MVPRLLFCLAAPLAATQAAAAVLEYEMTVGTMHGCVRTELPEFGYGCWRDRDFVRAGLRAPRIFKAITPMWRRPAVWSLAVIDESILGRSVADFAVEAQNVDAGWNPDFVLATGIVGGFLHYVAYIDSLSIRFGPDREILSFAAEILDGPPDWSLGFARNADGSSSGGFSQFFWGSTTEEYGYSSFSLNARITNVRLAAIDGVRIPPAPVPLPGTLALLGLALGGLAILRPRRG